ncbi:MAG: GH25 family lysozyme, partial [Oscillospiraceae bacterium]
LAFLWEITLGGFSPMLYSYTSFFQSFLDVNALEAFDFWVADYREPTGTKCPYKGKHSIWQYMGDAGTCDGVLGSCDLNICYKNYGENEKPDYERLFKELYGEIQNLQEKYKGRP